MEHVRCPISENAQAAPDLPALITEEHTWDYRALDRTIDSLCSFLKEAGIKPQQRIAYIAKNEPAAIFLLFALFRLGAIACPLSYRLPQEQLTKHLERLNPSHILDPAALPLDLKAQTSFAPQIDLDASATFLFTSGSSGAPKIACHSYGNHYYNALGVLERLPLTTTSRWLLSLPLFHVSGIGILFRCFLKGAAVVMPQALEQATHLSLVPTQLYRMLQEPTCPPLQCIVLGGAPIPADLLQRAKEKNLPVFSTYGLTETASMMVLSDKNTPSGKPLPFREIKIDETGEIWVAGKTLFQGYWDNEKIVSAALDGWFPTKDIGRWTSSDQLEVIGRKDRMFISGGENIHPEEIESALLKVPGILRARVQPIADPEFGHRPIAFIDDKTNAHTLQSIREALKSVLPSFKHPVRIMAYPSELQTHEKLI